MKTLVTSIFAASVVLAGLACAQAEERTSIRIGLTVSSTGPYAVASQSGERGIGIWVDDVNSRGGIELDGKKYPVELVKRDDRSDKQLVSRVYESLITEEKIDALIAPFSSTLVGVAAPIVESRGGFMVSWAGSSDQLFQQGYKNIVSVTAQASQIPVTSIALAEKVGVKKLAVISVDEPFPASAAAAAKGMAEKAGMEVVLFEKYPKGTKDFAVLLQKAQAAGADGFYSSSYDGDLIVMLRQMREREIEFPYTYMLYGSSPAVIEAGADADYIFSHTQFDANVDWPVTDGLTTKAFLAAYDKLNPNAAYPADFQTALAYGAGAILEKSIATANSVEPEKLKQAALDISGKTVIVSGKFEIDDTGFQHGMTPIVLQKQPEGLKIVAPEEIKTADPIYPIPAWTAR
ncbi:amino acid ABC transporter substrate-binding protein [Nitratireductor indicus]|uniref:amino acid ABC transporter substrate-binding protein n=1 Tax=Nitratireductor indicus TaxID=721133 RepID=UPI00287528E9|nr:amino acid ABC transporter substrate-binding protein [Nitratireductor indicus]MDS1135154.1 amino acid ABC transporter substrate-binding protein [Nitratireductor indicus]